MHPKVPRSHTERLQDIRISRQYWHFAQDQSANEGNVRVLVVTYGQADDFPAFCGYKSGSKAGV